MPHSSSSWSVWAHEGPLFSETTLSEAASGAFSIFNRLIMPSKHISLSYLHHGGELFEVCLLCQADQAFLRIEIPLDPKQILWELSVLTFAVGGSRYSENKLWVLGFSQLIRGWSQQVKWKRRLNEVFTVQKQSKVNLTFGQISQLFLTKMESNWLY